MTINKKFIDQFVRVTSRAALATSYLIGKKDKIAADKAATDSMRSELNRINMNGKIVIGEGELDKAPMLYIGELIGSKNGPFFYIAVDPLQGTNFSANNKNTINVSIHFSLDIDSTQVEKLSMDFVSQEPKDYLFGSTIT